MVMVKTNRNPVSTVPVGPLGDIRTTNMMVNGKRMDEARSSVLQSLYLSVYLAAVFFADVLRVSTALGLMLCILSGDP